VGRQRTEEDSEDGCGQRRESNVPFGQNFPGVGDGQGKRDSEHRNGQQLRKERLHDRTDECKERKGAASANVPPDSACSRSSPMRAPIPKAMRRRRRSESIIGSAIRCRISPTQLSNFGTRVAHTVYCKSLSVGPQGGRGPTGKSVQQTVSVIETPDSDRSSPVDRCVRLGAAAADRHRDGDPPASTSARRRGRAPSSRPSGTGPPPGEFEELPRRVSGEVKQDHREDAAVRVGVQPGVTPDSRCRSSERTVSVTTGQ